MSDLVRKKLRPTPSDESLETKHEYKKRWRSIYIIYITIFVSAVGFSITVTGVWPYLDRLDPSSGKLFYGYAAAANPLGQMIFLPLVGWWTNKRSSIRLPILFSLILFTIINAIYSSLENFNNKKYWIIATRFLLGVSSANVATCSGYLSAATYKSERTKAISMIMLIQVLGFIVGPIIQAMVVPLGEDGVIFFYNKIKLNMYTTPSWINVLLSSLNTYLFLPDLFSKYSMKKIKFVKESWKRCNPDYFTIFHLLIVLNVLIFNVALLETIGTPLIMDQFAWSKADALQYFGIIMSFGAIFQSIVFVLTPKLRKFVTEMKILIWGSVFLMIVGKLFLFPFHNNAPQLYNSSLRLNLSSYCERAFFKPSGYNYNQSNNILWINNSSIHIGNKVEIRKLTQNCGEDLLGCPSYQEWCNYTPAINATQFGVAYFLTVIGYSIGGTLIQSIFWDTIRLRPHAVWIVLISACGCLSRSISSVFVTYFYEQCGPLWPFGLSTIMLVVCFVWLLWFHITLVKKQEINDLDVKLTELKEIVSDNNVTEYRS